MSKGTFIFQRITLHALIFFVNNENTLYYIGEGQKGFKNSSCGDVPAPGMGGAGPMCAGAKFAWPQVIPLPWPGGQSLLLPGLKFLLLLWTYSRIRRKKKSIFQNAGFKKEVSL